MARTNNTRFYNASIKKYKKTARGVHWASKSRQVVRFEIFKLLLGETIKTSRIVDAGCGFGDLYTYLEKERALPLEYIGLDSHQKMVNLALEQTKQKIIFSNILTDALPEADYYLCSGAMNILEPFETILFIKKMLRYAQKGVIFNILKGDNHEAIYNKYMPEDMKALLSFFEGSIEIIEDYLDGDFTVFLKKAS